MALRITHAAEPISVEHIIVTVYSAPGVGKTSLGYTADQPLLLDFDSGAYRAANRGDTVQVKAWADVAGITADDLKPYRTLVLDTAGRALDSLAADIIAVNPKHGRGGGALSLPGFGELKARFIAFTKLVRSFGLDLVMLVHSDEQRSGDDLIERLDAQGASKNEIYKVSDLMGRIKIEAGKRVLNFNPTDTAFGKNPAGFAKLDVPDFATIPNYLATIITETKSKLNQMTAEQKETAKELGNWQDLISKLGTAEAFDGMIPLIAKDAGDSIRDNVKRLLVKAAKDKGFTFDKAAGKFTAKKSAA